MLLDLLSYVTDEKGNFKEQDVKNFCAQGNESSCSLLELVFVWGGVLQTFLCNAICGNHQTYSYKFWNSQQ